MGQKYDYKSDSWMLGCILYEMCTFKKPFEGDALNVSNLDRFMLRIDCHQQDYIAKVSRTSIRLRAHISLAIRHVAAKSASIKSFCR